MAKAPVKRTAKPKGKGKGPESPEGLLDRPAETTTAIVEEPSAPRPEVRDGGAAAEQPEAPAAAQGPAPKGDREPRQEREGKGKPGGNGGPTINIAKLQAMSMNELNQMAKEMGIENFGTMRKHEVIFHILQKNAERSGILFSEGVLEVLPEGFGFLRSQSFNYLPCPEDIYISPSQIRRC